MALKSLDQLRHLRSGLLNLHNVWLKARGVTLGERVSISLSARLEPSAKAGITIGAYTLVAFKTLLTTRAGERAGLPIVVGAHCFVGGASIILPGVTIGDECIVAAGAVVFEDVPARCIVGGNPARVLRREIEVGAYGLLKRAYDMDVSASDP